MKQRGRKSAANLATLIDVTGTPSRLTTPAGLTKPERSLFDFIVDASPPHHFTDSDQPLLLSYVQACLMARSAAKTPAKVAIFERVVRLQATLATKGGCYRARLAGPLELNVDRLGSDFDSFDLDFPDLLACQVRCDLNEACRGWTYVNPGVQKANVARCWLKNSVPSGRSNNCCISGHK